MSHYIRQHLLDELEQLHDTNKVVVIYGPRRAGKTTLLNKLLEDRKNYLLVSGEDAHAQQYLASQSIETLKRFVGNHELLVVDEAQKVPNIGLNLKLLIDHCEGLQIIVTGSSAFDLAQQIGEPLTGRKRTLKMFPLSQMELSREETPVQTAALLEARLVFGSYPEVILMKGDSERREYLHELTQAYLYKDILELDGLKHSNKLVNLLRLLAFQIGQEVSLAELGRQLGLHKDTVAHYLDLLEKSFVLIRVHGFSRNARKEVTKMPKYYFYDLGVRNAVINQFNLLSLRDDVGQLWENYLVLERLKKQAYKKIWKNNYFWRTYDKQEIDWVEEGDGQLEGFEFKWRKLKATAPAAWKKIYVDAGFMLIHKENYLDFIL